MYYEGECNRLCYTKEIKREFSLQTSKKGVVLEKNIETDLKNNNVRMCAFGFSGSRHGPRANSTRMNFSFNRLSVTATTKLSKIYKVFLCTDMGHIKHILASKSNLTEARRIKI